MEIRERFTQNIERWMQFCPEAAQLEKFALSEGDLSIRGLSEAEAAVWVEKLNFDSFNLLYVYGIGDFAPYPALKDWCQQKDHFLVILEDDLEAIAHYFKTEHAHDLLHAENIWLYYLDPHQLTLKELARFFPGESSYSCATIYSQESKLNSFREIAARIDFYTNYYKTFANEQATFGINFLHNYCSNVFLWPHVSYGDALFDQFKDVPAIICGAGPSLAKNIECLKTLKEHALIFAGGTAMNALNAAGMNPHFGVGIDPNPEQVTRIIMNSAFEVPFLYRNRMHREALNLVHSDKFYISGANGYEIPEYFEKGCGIDGHTIDEGCNVVNFSVDIARKMGCNPILLVGVDLAYSHDKSYAPGLQHHPIHRHFRTKDISEELIYRKDIYGNSVPTLWKWVTEAIWFSDFAAAHPETKLINCTEGGIGFLNVPNEPLASAAQKYLVDQQGMGTRLFGTFQRCNMSPLATQENIFVLFEKMIASLADAEKILQAYNAELVELKHSAQQAELTAEEFKVVLHGQLKAKFESTPSYHYFLEGINRNFDAMKRRQFHRLILDYTLLTPAEWQARLLELEYERSLYLQKAASASALLMQKIRDERKAKDSRLALPKENIRVDPPIILGSYSFENNFLKMEDPECDLCVLQEFTPDPTSGLYRLMDAQGHLIFESYRKEGKLHGPTRYYGVDHALAAESWYLDGRQVGKAVSYYARGEVRAILRYKEGLQHGKQEYYYRDQTPQTIIEHDVNGLLEGNVYLFHRNGLLARKLHYQDGKRDGTEYLWSEHGILIMEANFLLGNPIGISRVWSAEGRLMQEIFYNDDSEVVSRVHWDHLGNLMAQESGTKGDYFQEVAKNTEILTQNLSLIFKEMSALAPLLEQLPTANSEAANHENDLQTMAQELVGIGEALKGLEEMNAKLMVESGLNHKNQSEVFWKTSSLQKEVESKLESASKQMKAELESLSENLKKTMEDLSKKL